MSQSHDIQVNQQQLRHLERTLAGIPNAMPRVVSRAINRTATQARSRAVKAIASAGKLKQKDVRQKVRLVRASWKKWRARIFFDSRLTPVVRLDPRNTSTGITYRSFDGPKEINHAFLATMPSGHRGVWSRASASRLPIYEEYGDESVAAFTERSGVLATIKGFSATAVEKELDTQMRVLLSKRG